MFSFSYKVGGRGSTGQKYSPAICLNSETKSQNRHLQMGTSAQTVLLHSWSDVNSEHNHLLFLISNRD